MVATRRRAKIRIIELREQLSQDAAPRVDRAAGIIYGVKIIGTSSRNTHGIEGVDGTDYTPEALQSAVPLYEGMNVNVDHPDRDKPNADRSARDRFAWLEKVEYRPGEGDYGNLCFLDPTDPLAVKMMNAAEKKPNAFALSHNAKGRYEVEGRRAKIQEIRECRSVDIVADGGSNIGLFESERRKGKKKMGKTIKEALEALLPKSKKRLKRLFESDYVDPAMEMDAAADPLAGAPDGGGEGEAGWEDHIGNAIVAILKDEGVDNDEKKKKILALMKTMHDEPAPTTGGETDAEEGEDEEEEKDAVKEKKTEESLRLNARLETLERENADLKIAKLCESMNVQQPGPMLLEALRPLDEAKRKQFITQSRLALAPQKPRSISAGRMTSLQESASGAKLPTVEEFVAAIT